MLVALMMLPSLVALAASLFAKRPGRVAFGCSLIGVVPGAIAVGIGFVASDWWLAGFSLAMGVVSVVAVARSFESLEKGKDDSVGREPY